MSPSGQHARIAHSVFDERNGSPEKGKSRSDFWRNLIQQQVGSGQSVSVCSERGLTEQSLYYWRKHLNLSKVAPVSFALVTTDQPRIVGAGCGRLKPEEAAGRGHNTPIENSLSVCLLNEISRSSGAIAEFDALHVHSVHRCIKPPITFAVILE